jgi:triphosphoribosyl-dephospho-CoA synthetase
MFTDSDIYRAANLIIRKCGDGAIIYAGARADRLLETGNEKGNNPWLKVLNAVQELLSEVRPAGNRLH